MSQSLVGQILKDQFRVDAFIGSGGMGVVYRVWDMKRNASLAMKVLHSDLAEDPAVYKRFKREAVALQKLTHPNIVPFYGLYQTAHFAFLLEGFVDGTSLKNVLRDRTQKALSVAESLIFLKALCAALGYAHVNGVVHCDVKPANVMLDQGGNIYLTDFGIARHADSTLTTIGVAGSPAYMAPEQIKGEAVTPATDVYALGVILFEMLTGKRPFRGTEEETESSGTTAAERIRYAHLHLSPPNITELNNEVPNRLAAVVNKALAKNPVDRFQSVQAMFEAALAGAKLAVTSIPDRTGTLTDRFVIGSAVQPQAKLSVEKRRFGPATWLIAIGSLGVTILLFSIWALGGPDSSQIFNITSSPQSVRVIASATAPSIIASTPQLTDEPLPTHTREVVPTPTRFLPPTHSPEPTPGCPPPRLAVGDWASVSIGSGQNAIRSSPDTRFAGNIIGYLAQGVTMDILSGPICSEGLLLWNVRTYDGLEGWIAEGESGAYWLAPGIRWKACPSAPDSRIQVGYRAAVTHFPALANNVRTQPGLDKTRVGRINPGQTMEIIGGPGCSDNMVYWEVWVPDLSLRGWTAEGDYAAYWLIPIPD